MIDTIVKFVSVIMLISSLCFITALVFDVVK